MICQNIRHRSSYQELSIIRMDTEVLIMHSVKMKRVSKAWLHHKGRNKHHFEYWIDYDVDGNSTILAGMKMPVKYVAEMFCDRVAMSRIYNKDNYKDSDPLDYYIKGLGHYIMHPETDELLHNLLKMLADKGEEYTFAYIKANVLKKKKKGGL